MHSLNFHCTEPPCERLNLRSRTADGVSMKDSAVVLEPNVKIDTFIV